MFHSVVANAAMSVGGQVNQAVTNLSSNFQTAFNPQITKSYAAQDYQYLKNLVFSTSKISYFLLFLVSLPLVFNIDQVLSLWLETVPDGSAIFCILLLGNGILNALSAPLNFCVMATGNIKWFQIVSALVYLSDLIILYLLFSLGFPPATAVAVKLCIMVLIVFVRMLFASKEVPSISLGAFTKEVLFPIVITSIICVLLYLIGLNWSSSTWARLVITIVLFLSSCILSIFVGLSKQERLRLKSMFHGIMKRA